MEGYKFFKALLLEEFGESVSITSKFSEDKEVYLGKNQGQYVVVKFVEKESFNEALIDVLLSMNHKNIAEYYEIRETDKYYVLVREYIAGKTLFEYVEEMGNLDENYLIHITKKLIDALQYLHTGERKLAYRDLHPKNIVINEFNEPVLIDLMTLREYKDGSNSDTTVIGALGFIAPEQFGYSQSSEKSDIYSLGAVMYYSLTGSIPLIDSDYNNDNILKTQKIIKKMLSFSPRRRSSSLSEVRKLLDKLDAPIHLSSFIKGFLLGTILVLTVNLFVGTYTDKEKDLALDNILVNEKNTKEDLRSIEDESIVEDATSQDAVTEVVDEIIAEEDVSQEVVKEVIVDDEDVVLVYVDPFKTEGENYIHPKLVVNEPEFDWVFIPNVVGMNTKHIRNFSVYKHITDEHIYIKVDFEATATDRYLTMFFGEDYPGLKALFDVNTTIGKNSHLFEFDKKEFADYTINMPQESRLLGLTLYSDATSSQRLFIPIDFMLN